MTSDKSSFPVPMCFFFSNFKMTLLLWPELTTQSRVSPKQGEMETEKSLCSPFFSISPERSSETSARRCSSTTNCPSSRRSSRAKVSVHSVFVCVLLLQPRLLVQFVLRACVCATINPEMSSSRLTTAKHEVEKDREEEQILTEGRPQHQST